MNNNNNNNNKHDGSSGNNNNNILAKLGNLTFSTLRLCKSLAKLLIARTLAFLPSSSSLITMDDDDFSLFNDDDDSNNLPLSQSRLPQRRRFDDVESGGDEEVLLQHDYEKLYLVPYRWWKEAQNDAGRTGGVLYNVLSKDDDDSEIVLNLRKQEGIKNFDYVEQGLSGHEYALLAESMWLQALKWHNDSTEVQEDIISLHGAEGHCPDVFPLKISLSVKWETNSLVVKISIKDNVADLYERARLIFSFRSELSHIWDLSGQITQFFTKENIFLADNMPGQPSEEVFLGLQIYGFSDLMKGRDERNNEMIGHSECGSVKMKGSGGAVDLSSTLINPSQLSSGYARVGILGLRGLQNLGNTCFMNSAIQCLVHTPELVEYFMGNYQKEINYKNPLGMSGEIALAFGDLLRKLWAPGTISVASRMFKLKLAKFTPQFSGYNQQDSQEFLSFLLDGLHEDLNRVKSKPFIEVKDEEDHPDEDVAEEYWHNHLARNNSIIVDLFHGQYQSKLVCPVCKKVSTTFDPLVFLSVPLPSTTMRTMTLTILSTDGKTLPLPCTVTVPKLGRFQDLVEALSRECSLRNDENLLVAEIYRNSIFQLLEEPSDFLDLIRDDDKLVAYRLPKDSDRYPLVMFTHQLEEKVSSFGRVTTTWKTFGIPFVARLTSPSSGSDIHQQFLKLLNPFLMPIEDATNDYDDVENTANEDSAAKVAIYPKVSNNDSDSDRETQDNPPDSTDFRFDIIEDKKVSKEIKMSEPMLISGSSKILEVRVSWSNQMIEKYDTCLLSTLLEVFKPQFFTKRPQELVSLYKCLEAFLKEEPLGLEDMWNCPSCKKPRQASKRLDLWRLPEILIVHLKRFSYSRIVTNKLETFVDFPIDGFDLSNYISHRSSQSSARYTLYAITNHYGGTGSGHYTAFVNLGRGKWYEFDDERVFPVSVDRIKTAAAYVLFYRRIPDA